MLGVLLGLFACSSLPTEEDSSSNVKSSVKFTMQNIANSANSNILFSSTDEQTPSKVAISYKKSGENEEVSITIKLTAFGNSYITDDVLSLYEGNYEITKFDVLNDEGTTIYSTPKAGSEKAKDLNITTALAYGFEVKEGKISKVDMQVVAVSDTTDPADFGHAAFTLDLVDYNRFYIEVLVLDDSLGWVYTTAQIEVKNAEETIIKTTSIENKMNKVIVANSTSYTITISKDGYTSQELTFTKAELEAYENEAMVVKLKKAEASEETGETEEGGEIDTTFHKAEWFLVGGELGIQRRSDWWDSLEEQWKKAFNDSVLSLGNITTKPSDENIQVIFNKTRIAVGYDFYGLTNLSGLKHLTNLTSLDCSGNQLSSLTGLENCINLTYLGCSNNQLSSLTELENCTNLKNLICGGNELSSLTGIENCTNLTFLRCTNNQLSSLTGLENCANLTTLWCSNNQLSNLEDIKNLTNLTNLSCSYNQLSSLTGLENCTNLGWLECYNNQISNEEVARIKGIIPNCNITNNNY